MKKSALINLIENLSSTAKKGKWELFYDKVADSLYWSKRKISSDTKLKKFSKETSLYIGKSGKVEGLMVQYFRNNFLTQNGSLANTDIVKSINKAESGKAISLGSRKDEVEALFSESIKNNILKDAFEANYTLRDLDRVLRV